MSIKAIIKNKDDEICLIFDDNEGWILPSVDGSADELESKFKILTGLPNVKLIKNLSESLVLMKVDDDLQNEIDMLIGWFTKEDAIISVHEKDRSILKSA